MADIFCISLIIIDFLLYEFCQLRFTFNFLNNNNSLILMKFLHSKTFIINVNHRISFMRNFILISIIMAAANIQEYNSLCFFGITFSTDIKSEYYIESVAGSADKKGGSLWRAPLFFSPESVLRIYKSTIRPGIGYCCHLWSGDAVIYVEVLEKIQSRFWNIIYFSVSSHHRIVNLLCLF